MKDWYILSPVSRKYLLVEHLRIHVELCGMGIFLA